MGDRPEAVGDEVTSGQHREHAGRRASLGGPDRAKAGMGMRRAQHDGVDLAVQVEIIAVGAFTGDQAEILAAPHRLSDAGTGRGARQRMLRIEGAHAGRVTGAMHGVNPPSFQKFG